MCFLHLCNYDWNKVSQMDIREKISDIWKNESCRERRRTFKHIFYSFWSFVSFMKAKQRMSFNFSTIITVVEFLNEQINSKPLIQLSDDRKITTVTGTLIHENQWKWCFLETKFSDSTNNEKSYQLPGQMLLVLWQEIE